MRRGALIKAPSGVMVEIKEVREVITLVYQLDEQGNRIKERKINGKYGYLLGIISTNKIKNNLCKDNQ